MIILDTLYRMCTSLLNKIIKRNCHNDKIKKVSFPTSAAAIHNHRRIPFYYLKVKRNLKLKFIFNGDRKKHTIGSTWDTSRFRRKY